MHITSFNKSKAYWPSPDEMTPSWAGSIPFSLVILYEITRGSPIVLQKPPVFEPPPLQGHFFPQLAKNRKKCKITRASPVILKIKITRASPFSSQRLSSGKNYPLQRIPSEYPWVVSYKTKRQVKKMSFFTANPLLSYWY